MSLLLLFLSPSLFQGSFFSCEIRLANGCEYRLQIEHTGRRIMEKTLQWALRSGVGSEAIPFDTMSDVRVLESV